LIYSGLKLHPKPLVPTISMPSMTTNPLSIVKTLSLGNEKQGENSTTKNLTSSPSIRLVTSTTTTGKSSPPTTLQFQFVDKSTNSNGTFSTSKTFFFNPQQTSNSASSSSSTTSNSSSLVTLIPPGMTSSKIQTFISPNNEISNGNDLNHQNNKTTSFIGKNRLTLVTSSTSSTSNSSSVTPKLVIQQNSTSNLWSPQSTTKILSAKMISHPVQLKSTDESNCHPPLIHMSVVPSTSRPMDHNNNHQSNDETNSIKTIHPQKISMKNRTRLPLQPSSQQISSILPSTKKQKFSDDEQTSTNEPPTKLKKNSDGSSSSTNVEEKKLRQHRNRSLTNRISVENSNPTTNDVVPTKKRSSAELATAAILSTSQSRKKRLTRKFPEEISSNSTREATLNDDLVKILSQDFLYEDRRTGIRWIARKSRSQPMNTLASRVSWKPKINHYEKTSDVIRLNSKRTVPLRSPETIRKIFLQTSSSWRIHRLTNYLTDLTEDEQTTQNVLTDLGQSLSQLKIDDEQIRVTIDDLIEENVQRHRNFAEQLTQISSLLLHLLTHENTLKEIQSTSKTNSICSTTRRTAKERS